MVEPEVGPLAAELAAHGTDASPLEAVLEPVPDPEPAPPPRVEVEGGAGEGEAKGPASMALVGTLPEALLPLAVLAAEGEPAEETEVVPEPAAETYYDALGVTPRASREQIEKAHRFCLEMYKEGALATYSLLEPGDAEAARRRIHLAFETLHDPDRRLEYDRSLGLSPAAPAELPVAPGESRPSQDAASAYSAPDLPAGPLLGADLRRLRESRGVTLREIAVSSKIGLRFLEYIEEDRLNLLPPAVYLRGFLQQYARALGVDPRLTADAYMARLAR